MNCHATVESHNASLEELIQDFHGLNATQRASIRREKLALTTTLLRSYRRMAQLSAPHAAVELALDASSIAMLAEADDERIDVLARQCCETVGMSVAPSAILSVVPSAHEAALSI